MRVFKYWAEPASPADRAWMSHQLRGAAWYRKALAFFENAARAEERAIDLSDPRVRAKVTRLTNQRRYLAATTHPGRREIWERCIERTKRQLTAIREHRRKHDALFNAAITAVRDRLFAINKLAAAAAGAAPYRVAWGTRAFVNDAHEQACRTTPIYDDVNGFTPSDEGAIAVQLQKPFVYGHAVIGGDDTRVQISKDRYALATMAGQHRVACTVPTKNRGGNARSHDLQQLAIRTGSVNATGQMMSGGHTPFWTYFHVKLQRDVPSNAKITWVRVHQVRIGRQYRWNAQFVVDESETTSLVPAPTPTTTSMVAVNLGWRRLGNGDLRVAYAIGTDGRHHQLTIPMTVSRRSAKSDDLRSIRDQYRNVLQEYLRVFRRTLAPNSWFVQRTVHMHVWNKSKRYVRLLRDWSRNRFAGDQQHFMALQAWFRRDSHLLDWEAHNRVRMQYQVRGRYETWISDLFKQYDTVVLLDLDIAALQALAPSAQNLPKNLAHKRKLLLAPGDFNKRLRSFAMKRRRAIVDLPPMYVSMDCTHCQHRHTAGAPLVVTCPQCGHSEDQDVRAASNMLLEASRRVQNNQPTTLAARKPVKKLRARRNRKRVVSMVSSP